MSKSKLQCINEVSPPKNPKFPHSIYPGETSGFPTVYTLGKQGIYVRWGNKVYTLEDLIREGWSLRVKRVKGNYYLTVRKKINGKRIEKSIGKISEEVYKLLVEKGLLKNENGTRGKHRSKAKQKVESGSKVSNFKPNTPSTNNTTTPQHQEGGNGRDGVKPPSGGNRVGGFWVHRLDLRFVRSWVSRVHLGSLGFRFDPRNKQYYGSFVLGRGRVLKVQVNSDCTAQVYLNCSERPLDVFEFIGFCRIYLLCLFRELCGGREVSLSDFVVIAAPHVNCDVPGVTLEGVKCVTLENYCDEVLRIYFKESSSLIPDGGLRVEVEARSLQGSSLNDVVEGLIATVKLPVLLNDMKKTLDEIKGGLSIQQINAREIADIVSTQLYNLLHLMFNRLIAHIEKGLIEGLNKVFKKVEELERENRILKLELERLKQQYEGKMRFNNLPGKLKEFLKELEKEGFIRIYDDRVAFGDRVWEAIFKCKGNIDGWIIRSSDLFIEDRDLFLAVMRAIRYYDNKWNGKPGVPYDLFLDKVRDLLGGRL